MVRKWELHLYAIAAVVFLMTILVMACAQGIEEDRSLSVEVTAAKDEASAGETSSMTEEPVGPPEAELEDKSFTEEDAHNLRLAVVGDLMVHGPQLRAQQQPDGTHDFRNNFEFVKPWLQSADVVVGNLETTFAGPAREYSSFPRFNTPDAFGEALLASGFHGVSTVNNHSIDTGAQGFFRTLSLLDELGIKTMGTRQTETDEFWELFTHDGIVLGITAVSYETPRAYGRRTLNALLVPRDLEGLINSFDYNTLQEDLSPAKKQIAHMKEAGADITAVMVHWGEEYQLQQNKWQERIANELAAAGADLILGSHPHVLQPVRRIQSDPEGPVCWVVYSSGNFISNQRYEILERHEPEDGAILFVDIARNRVDGTAVIEEVSYQPTWVHRYWENDRMVYEILPLTEALQLPESYNLTSSNSLIRAQKSFKRTTVQWSNLPLAHIPMQTPATTGPNRHGK